MSNQDWSTEPPSEPGWYWWRNLPDFGVRIMHVPFTIPEVVCASSGQAYGAAKLIEGEWWPEKIIPPAPARESLAMNYIQDVIE